MCALSFEIRKQIMEDNERRFQKDLEYGRLEDLSYALDTDEDLTDAQKAEVDAFWDKYKFVADMGYNACKTFYNRSGIFDPRYVPYYFLKKFVRKNTAPEKYLTAFQNKAYIPKLFSNAKQPKTIVRRVEGIYYNTDFEKISLEEAVDLCMNRLKEREIVVKPSGLAGGKGVEFFREATREQMQSVLENKGELFVVQDAIHQHPEMARLNSSTVNTVRLTTMIHKGEFIPLAALVKVGAPNVRVDNYKHGGCLIGINIDGTTPPWAINVEREPVDELPAGINLAKGDFPKVPCFDSVLKTAEKAHYNIPKIKLISWDIAIDDENEAEIIEANFGGDVKMHQALTGPIFGDLTEEILNTYCLSDFCREGASELYDYLEYHDHIVITQYHGTEDTEVAVPKKINGKPVTVLSEGAFKYHEEITLIRLPSTVHTIGKHVFFGCSNLTRVRFATGSLENVESSCVNHCPSMPAKYKSRLRHGGKTNAEAAKAGNTPADGTDAPLTDEITTEADE